MTTRSADVVVVGAGILGTFHAYFAARRGLSVALLERNPMPADASVRNFGMTPRTIVPVDGEWAGYARDTAEIYQRLQRERDITVRQTGSLYLASTPAEAAVLAEFASLHGSEYRCVLLDPAAACRQYPFIQETYCAAALFFPEDLTLDPAQLLPRLIPYIAEQESIEYVPNSAVVAVEACGSECRVRLARGEQISAGAVIICSGAECMTLFPQVFELSRLRLCKLQMMRTVALPSVLPHAILSGLSIARYPAFAGCPSYGAIARPANEDLDHYGIHVLLKQAADGRVILGDSHEYVDVGARQRIADRTTPAINDAILGYAQAMIRLPSWTLSEMWNGYYLQHPTDPIFTATIEGKIHVVTGIAGKGMSTAPGFARASVERLLG